jgi:hypothetical protein
LKANLEAARKGSMKKFLRFWFFKRAPSNSSAMLAELDEAQRRCRNIEILAAAVEVCEQRHPPSLGISVAGQASRTISENVEVLRGALRRLEKELTRR